MFAGGMLSLDDLDGFDLVYLSGITLAILPPDDRARLIRRCGALKEAGGAVVFDSNYRPRLWPDAATAQAAIMAMWAASTMALPSRDDEAALFGEAGAEATLQRIAATGVAEIALKDGPSGPHLWTGTALPRGSYPPASAVVDTTAAGDSFNAGYIAARLGGADVPTAAQAGHALAARVIGVQGAIIPR
jgi:2-dehydro-3-deoxygluconokinase